MNPPIWKRLVYLFLLMLLAACDGWNDPYPGDANNQSVLYTAFTGRPKHLDPAQAYSENEYEFLAQIYAPPLQYHYLKRPYQLVPLAASAMPVVRFLDKQHHALPDNAATDRIAFSVYEIHLRDDLRYQPHPAFSGVTQDLLGVHSLSDFSHTGTRRVTAADYVYQIKRLAHPQLHVPIAGVMSEYIAGFKDYAATLQQAANQHPDAFLDLNQFDLPGVQVVDEHTYRITINGKYPQFEYWLAMPFFAPMPFEAEKFYAQAGMRERNLSLDWWPVGSGPYYLSENDPNQRMVLTRNPNYMSETYPTQGEPGDAQAGLLADAGKALPLVDQVVFTLEKETIPYWNKFLQGYYDASGISSDSFDQAVQVNVSGEASVTDSMQAQGITLSTAVETSTLYTGFNWLDPVVGGGCDTSPEKQPTIRLGEPTTLAKSLVMAKPSDCGSCRPSAPVLREAYAQTCRDRSERARKLRQAISIAVDFEEFVSIFANGRGIAAQSPIPPGIFGYRDGEAGINPVVYDWVAGKLQRKSIATAKRLLAEAGYPDGVDAQTHQPLVINLDTTATGAGDKSRLDWMRKQFEKINVQLVVRSTDYNRFQDKIRKGDMQMFYYGWNADYPDPENFLFLLSGAQAKVARGGENAANYSDPEFDRLFEQMKNMDNTPQRQKIIDQMLVILHRDSPWLWGYHPKKFVLQHAWLHNVKPNVMANNKLKYWRVDDALRERSRRDWNHPVLWPLWLGAAVLLMFGVWMWRVLKRREQAKL
ncbi:MAG: ABC transporter substrate-binding protein [Gallionella sp.]|jgi:ABC-type transport system substrate-binding protein|nr:ABC transporter substrate-binding protein [Gallionella sp.]